MTEQPATPARTTRERLVATLGKYLPDDATFDAAVEALDAGEREKVVRTLGKYLPDDATFDAAVDLLDAHLATIGNAETDAVVDVWVHQHDDESVAWVINTRSEIQENFDDLVADGLAGDMTFEGYLDTWHHMAMPADVYFADDRASRDWVTANY